MSEANKSQSQSQSPPGTSWPLTTTRPPPPRHGRPTWQDYDDDEQARQPYPPVPRPLTSVSSCPSPPGCGVSAAALWHHVDTHWPCVFGMPKTTLLLGLVQTHAYLRNVLLAIAASHLRHVVRDTRPLRVAEHFRQSVALRDFQARLGRAAAAADETDAILLAGILINMMTFLLPPDEDAEPARHADGADPARSWVFARGRDRLDWLGVQMGFKWLLQSVQHSWQTALRVDALRALVGGLRQTPVFAPDDDGGGGRPRLPWSWRHIFGVDGDNDDDEDDDDGGDEALYGDALWSLAEVRRLEPTQRQLYRYLCFPGRIGAGFKQRLYEGDERALWTMGLWLGCMCRFGRDGRGHAMFWWMERRVRRDHRAVVMALEQRAVAARPGLAGRAWADMMKHLQDAPFWRPPDHAARSLLPVHPRGRGGSGGAHT